MPTDRRSGHAERPDPVPREKRKLHNRRRGHAVVDLALLAPWVFFLFIGALDWGFFAYALISAQNAARLAATASSASATTAADSALACTAALDALRTLPNVGSALTTCNADPVVVTATAITGPDGGQATRVVVEYQTVPLIPIPGLLQGQFTFVRSVQMRLRG
jgi:Flp pilus assembly protein TadG